MSVFLQESEAFVCRRVLAANNIRSRVGDSTVARARASESGFLQERKRFRDISVDVSFVLGLGRVAVETRHQIASLFKPCRCWYWGKRRKVFQENIESSSSCITNS